MAASVGPSTSFYREGIVQHGQSPPSHGCLLSLGLELLPVWADKALALLPLHNLLLPPWHFIYSITITTPWGETFVFMSGFFRYYFIYFHCLHFFVLVYMLPHAPWFNQNLYSGMKTVVLVFDFLVFVFCVVICINHSSWKMQYSMWPRPYTAGCVKTSEQISVFCPHDTRSSGSPFPLHVLVKKNVVVMWSVLSSD